MGSQSTETSDELITGSGQKNELFRKSSCRDDVAGGMAPGPRKPQKEL